MVIRFDEPPEPLRITPSPPNVRRVDEFVDPPRLFRLPRLMPGDGTARISVMRLLDELPDENDRRIDGLPALDDRESDERTADPRLTEDGPRRMPCDCDEPKPLRDRLIPLREIDRESDPERVNDPGHRDDEIPDDRPTLDRVPRLMFERVDGAMLDRERLMPDRLIPDRERLMPDRLIPDRERLMPELDRLRLMPRDDIDDRDRLMPPDRDEGRDRLIPREPEDDRDRLMPPERPRDWALPVSVNARTLTAAIIQMKLGRVILIAVTSEFQSAGN